MAAGPARPGPSSQLRLVAPTRCSEDWKGPSTDHGRDVSWCTATIGLDRRRGRVLPGLRTDQPPTDNPGLRRYDYATDLYCSTLPSDVYTYCCLPERASTNGIGTTDSADGRERSPSGQHTLVRRHTVHTRLTAMSVMSEKSASFSTPLSACSLSRRLFSRAYHTLQDREMDVS